MAYLSPRHDRVSASGRCALLVFMMLSLLIPTLGTRPTIATAQLAESPVTLGGTAILAWTEPWRGGDLNYSGITLFDDGGVKVHVLTFSVPGGATPEEVLMSESLRPNGWEDAASGIDTGGGYYYMAVGVERGQPESLNYTRGFYDETSALAIMIHVQTPIGRFQDVLTSIPHTITLNDFPLYGDLDFEEVVSTFEAGAGFDIPGPHGAGQPESQVDEPEAETDASFTMQSGVMVSWEEPWHPQYGSEPDDVSLITPDGVLFMVRQYPATEDSPETAATVNARSEATVVNSSVENGGGFSHLQWFNLNSGPIVEYTRAWTSADGQWTMSAYLRSELKNFHRDLTLVTESISLDGVPLWADIDADAVAASVQESSGMEVPIGGLPASEFTSVNGTVFGYPGDWTPDPSMEAPDGISLLAGDTSLLVGDFAEDQDPEAFFNSTFESLQKADQGPTPDGGYYGLAYGEDLGGRDYYLLFRFLYAEATGTPVIVLLNAPVSTFDWSLELAHRVTANGQPVLEGLDDAALLATFENGGPTGAAIFTGGQASQPVATAAPEAPAMSGNEITGPAGTLFSWSDTWIYEQMEGMPPSVVVLYGNEVPATIMIFEGAAGQGVDEMWAEYSSTGGEVLDEGQSPDGGYYEISYNAASDSPVGSTTPSYTLTLAYATDTAPILVSLVISGEDFQPSLDAARDVTANGVPILNAVDDAALIAVFQNGGPTGDSIFTGGEAPASTEPSANETGNGNGTESGSPSPRDVIANVPALPERDPDPTPEEGDGLSYTSELFGYTLAWTDAWQPYEDAIETDPDEGYDMYTLESAEGMAAGIYVVGGEGDDELDVDDYIDYWSSDEYIEENEPRGTELLMADSGRDEGAVVLLGPANDDDDELWVSVYEIRVVDDEIWLELSFVSTLDDFEDAYDDAQETITVDGEPVIGYFSTDEIMDELPEG